MPLELGKHTTLYFVNEWKQLFQIRRCNWYSFTPFHLYFEVDSMCHTLEWTYTVWGIGVSLHYTYDFTHSEAYRIAQEAWAKLREQGDTPI